MVKKNYDNMLSRFHRIPERHGQTGGQTDRNAISISRVSMLRATLRPFARATFPSLTVCLYLAYSKLLKLTAASNAGGV